MELTVLEEAPAAEMEEECPEEVVNCKCGLNEENGFMIQVGRKSLYVVNNYSNSSS